MKITIVHQEVAADAPADEHDVLDQAAAIRDALRARGHAVTQLPCTLDLGNVRRKLEVLAPDCVFNLVETLEGSGRLIHLAPAAWEVAGIPFTGSSAEALTLTTQKLLAKERMLAAGLPVPEWVGGGTFNVQRSTFNVQEPTKGDWIVKSVWEHASVGLGDDSVLRGVTAAEAAARLPDGCFAERYIEGREFNIGLLTGAQGLETLPPAEIVFEAYPDGKPRIVGYPAKWDTASFEYAHTVRRFVDPAADGPLLAELTRLSRRCWEAFGLGGYARVDFRVDADGRPWILEVNANPCLAPDSGFAAMLAQAGIDYGAAMERIVSEARGQRPEVGGQRKNAQRSTLQGPVTIRTSLVPEDVAAVREVTASTGYFHDHEIPVAVELAEERLAKGAASGYEFVFAEQDGRVVGYTSFGPIPCTRGSFDWYWLAVRPECQGAGLGRRLLQEVEARARAMGGARLYCETSGRPQYASTRAFYERMGFTLCEVLADYYEPGDGRATYVKAL
jgi:D-alanine-D-alanine ligase-like ATP-grasp enzyme/ribosomal protein S18 acetylase RimI-like enzyme